MSTVGRNAFTLSRMIDSSSPDQPAPLEMMPTPDSAMENIPPPQKTARGQGKGKARSKANTGNKVTKSKSAPRGRRGSVGFVADPHKAGVEVPTKRKGITTKKRTALGEKVNVQQEEYDEVQEMEDVACEDSMVDVDVRPDELPISHDDDDDDELNDSIVETKKRGKISKSKVQKDPVARIKAAAKGKKRVIQEETPVSMRQEDRIPKAGRARVKKITVPADVVDDHEKIIAETQPSPVDMQDSVMDDQREEEVQEEPVPQQPVIRHSSRAPRSPSQSRQQITIGGKPRGGSAAETDRPVGGGGGSDPMLRRKLGEMTRKYENLDSKYRNLRETGIKEAELNFSKLKRQMEEKSQTSEKLISSLQTSLNHQTNAIKESRSLEQKLISQTSEIEKLQSQLNQLTAKLASTESSNKTLSNKITSLEAENKSLTSKLTSTTTTRNNTLNNPPPSSTNKPSRPKPSTTDTTLLTTLQAKESLYSDLTGLIVPHIKQTGTSTIYDCIQTGRNGSLHFKVTITQPSTGNYEDTEFIFTPLLDEERDRSLIEILPDYLTEEITFARENAERFYLRVTEAVMKRK